MHAKPFETYANFEDWLDDVRLDIYEEIKDMTWEERNEYFLKETEDIRKQYNIKIVSFDLKPPVKPRQLFDNAHETV